MGNAQMRRGVTRRGGTPTSPAGRLTLCEVVMLQALEYERWLRPRSAVGDTARQDPSASQPRATGGAGNARLTLRWAVALR